MCSKGLASVRFHAIKKIKIKCSHNNNNSRSHCKEWLENLGNLLFDKLTTIYESAVKSIFCSYIHMFFLLVKQGFIDISRHSPRTRCHGTIKFHISHAGANIMKSMRNNRIKLSNSAWLLLN